MSPTGHPSILYDTLVPCSNASKHEAVFSRINASSQAVERWVDRDICRELNRFGVQPFKDSLKMDFASTMSGYLNRRQAGRDKSFPIVHISDESWEKKYDELIVEMANGEKSYEETFREIGKKSYMNSIVMWTERKEIKIL